MADESPLQGLHRLGQSPWLDILSRDLIESGELERLITHRGVRGVTSNPAIFHQAIAGGHAYDEDIHALARQGLEAGSIFETIAGADVSSGADCLRPIHDESGGRDGFVSLEVSPHLAHDTAGTVDEARRLWDRLARPNVMIKVPATAEGVPAIRRLLAQGVQKFIEPFDAVLEGIARRAG